MLSCEEVSRRISESFERKLSVWEQMQLWTHLSLCRICSAFRKDLVEIRQTTRQYAEPFDDPSLDPELTLPPEARDGIQRVLEGRDPEIPPS